MTEAAEILRRLAQVNGEIGKLDERRNELLDQAKQLAVEALRAGAAPTDVIDRSPHSSATIRSLARAAGIPPAKRQKRAPAGQA